MHNFMKNYLPSYGPEMKKKNFSLQDATKKKKREKKINEISFREKLQF